MYTYQESNPSDVDNSLESETTISPNELTQQSSQEERLSEVPQLENINRTEEHLLANSQMIGRVDSKGLSPQDLEDIDATLRTKSSLQDLDKQIKEARETAERQIKAVLTGDVREQLVKTKTESIQPHIETDKADVPTRFRNFIRDLYSYLYPSDDNYSLSPPELKESLTRENNLYLDGAINGTDQEFYDALWHMNTFFDASSLANYPEYREFAAAFIERNLPVIETRIQNTNSSEITYRALESVSALLTEGNKPQQELAGDFLIKNIERALLEYSKTGPNTVLPYSTLVEDLINSHNTQVRNRVFGIISSLPAVDNEKLLLLKSQVSRGVSKDKEIHSWREKLSTEVGKDFRLQIQRYGLDYGRFQSIWKRNSDAKRVSWFERSNCETIVSLEMARPGIVKELNTRYGIYNFARYPQDLLIKQYDHIEDRETPFGMVMGPLTDWNGAFHNNYYLFTTLDRNLNSKYLLRFVEANDKQKAAELLTNLRVRHGRLSFGILQGHGNHYSIELGQTNSLWRKVANIFVPIETRNRLTNQDLADNFKLEGQLKNRRRGNGRSLSRRLLTRFLFKQGAELVLISCSTGKRGWFGLSKPIGQKISEGGLTVKAPSNDSYPENISVDTNRDPLLPHFSIDYANTDARTGKKITVPTREFREGRAA